MMIDVIKLRNELDTLDEKQAYVKWWAKRSELDLILNRLNVDFEEIKHALDIKNNLYCIYVGRSSTRPIAKYLDMQLTQTESSIKDGLSAFRKTVGSVVSSNLVFSEETDNFLDKLKIEIFYIDYPVGSKEAKEELDDIIKKFLEKKLYVLNMGNNSHPLAKNIKKDLKKIRDEAIINANNYILSKTLQNDISKITVNEDDEKRNIIYFGAPGTGKSYNLNQDKNSLLENHEDNYERVTFHPDYSYANFVGTYKPVPEDEDITYEYVPGPFMRVLKNAIENPDELYLLIIEEINRANVAAVFGDIFQLLDRNDDNESVYPIDATEDMKSYLNQDKIIIPENMFIWATMNSADQGVFPMDTAFKRRWDFKYFSINNNEKLIENINVNLNGIEVNWNVLRKAINDELLSYKINEDKCMGPFFAFNDFMDENIDDKTFKDIFKNKIIMYMFEDAARAKRNDLFRGAKTKDYVTYSEICEKFDEIGIEIFCDNIKSKFISDDE